MFCLELRVIWIFRLTSYYPVWIFHFAKKSGFNYCIKHRLDAQIIIYSYNVTIPLRISSNRCPSSGGHIVYMQAMVSVTLKQVSGRILLKHNLLL
jgi:hypothetical protein